MKSNETKKILLLVGLLAFLLLFAAISAKMLIDRKETASASGRGSIKDEEEDEELAEDEAEETTAANTEHPVSTETTATAQNTENATLFQNTEAGANTIATETSDSPLFSGTDSNNASSGLMNAVQNMDTDAIHQTPANPAPDFTVYDYSGNAVNLSDFIGKPVIINFWATWCGPCKSELPHFNRAAEEYGDEIVFLMVDLTDGYYETIADAYSFISSNGYTFPCYYDVDEDGANTYNINAIPLTVVIDENGSIVQKREGSMDYATLVNYINMVL